MTQRLIPVALLTAALFSPVVQADGDHERARQALEAGEILPLRTILDRVEQEYPGQIIEVELEREDGLWIYEFKLLRANGALMKMKLDAGDGTLLAIKGRDLEPEAKGDF